MQIVPATVPATFPGTVPATFPATDLASGPGSVGQPIDRVDGRAKVTGTARYAYEAPVQGVAYGALVGSTIAKGKITAIDDRAARAAPGVIAVVTHLNRPDVTLPKPGGGGGTGETRLPLADATIHHAGQHVAIVVARTFEQARYAATLLKIDYAPEQALLDIDAPGAKAAEPGELYGQSLGGKVGDVDAALAADGVVRFEATYATPFENHNPMEPSASVAVFEGDRLTVYDSTQWIVGTRAIIADLLKMPRENVRVICPYVGGAFGCKGMVWPHTIITVMAAKVAGVPVKTTLTRAQMFVGCGHRPLTRQTVALAARPDGTLTAIRHLTSMPGSFVGKYVESCANGTSKVVYAAPNIQWKHEVTQLNLPEGTFMRAPGETPGSFALECAMDELAEQLNLDPLELRLKNYAKEKHATNGKPWSINNLADCYTKAAAAFGWARRDPKPRSTRDGDLMVGYGMATAMYPGSRFGGECRIRLMNDGRAIVSTSAHDMGQGAYTALTQMAADALGLDAANVRVEMGDSLLPPGPLAGGSNTTATCSVMIYDAAANLAKALDKPGQKGDALVRAVKASGKPFADATGTSKPGPEMKQYAFQSFGAHFVEVAIDPLMPRVRVRRVVSRFDVGRVVNPKTCRSQGYGGIIMGIGAALTEATRFDARSGRPTNDNLADYAIPTNADVPDIDVSFTDVPDPHFNPSGVRGVGEICITGVAAAIANAVYHATGTRIRALPIAPWSLIG